MILCASGAAVFVMVNTAAFADKPGFLDYDSIYDPAIYENKFDENTVIAAMQPMEWCGSGQEYLDRGVFDDISITGLDIIEQCVDPSSDEIGDLLLLRLDGGSREKVIETIETLKENEYVLYSTPNFTADLDSDADNTSEGYTYYLNDGLFIVDPAPEGSYVLALYKDDRLVSATEGNEISVNDTDFDKLVIMHWSSLSEMRPVSNSLTLSRDEVMSAPKPDNSEPRYMDIPNVYLTGDITGISKDDRVTLKMEYKSATNKSEGYVSAKWQGNAALNYDKKNFAIKIYKDEALSKKQKLTFKDWDKSNNYVLKANYIDATSARNIVASRLFSTLPNTELPSGAKGVVDGFPIRLYINGEYQGLYTWNKPKKGWVFGMDDGPNELLYFSNFAVGSGLFTQKYSADHYWELVYPDEHEDETEFDTVTDFVAKSSDLEFKRMAEFYLDLDSLLNYYVFSQVIYNEDGLGKNMNMATFNGTKWFVRPYDLDATFGLIWHGRSVFPADSELKTRSSVLWRKLEDSFPQQIYDRYILLRSDQLSEEKIISAFEYFMDEVGDELYQENLKRWPGIPGQSFMLDQIKTFVSDRYKYLDTYMEQFDQEK